MKTHLNYIFFLLIVIVACKKEEKKPKVIYIPAEEEKVPIKKDSTMVKISDLPIHFENTNFLLYPIGEYTVTDNSLFFGNKLSKDRSTDTFNVSNYGFDEITGNINNIKFQPINQDTLISLTDKPILIYTINLIHLDFKKQNRQYLVYTLADDDTNRDAKVNTDDIKSLYISYLNGTNFIKLSKEYHELLDWKYIKASNQLFFRTIEDLNKNGAFDNNDKIHYLYLNLNKDKVEPIEYFPV